MIVRFNSVFYTLCVALVCGLVAPLHAYVIIQEMCDAPVIIDRPGTWLLDTDLIIHGAQGILIMADDVMLDLNGKQLCGAKDADVAIIVRGNNCTIKNGTVRNFNQSGIELDHVEDTMLENLQICGVDKGVSIVGGSCNNLDVVHITRVRSTGLEIKNSIYATIRSCVVSVCREYGICIEGVCDGSSCDGLTIDQCMCGLYLASNHLQCSCAQIKECTDCGVIIKGDSVTCSTMFSAQNLTGFHITGSDVTLHTCTATYNLSDGLVIDAACNNTKIRGGIYSANGAVGINNYALSTKVYGVSAQANTKSNMKRTYNAMG